MLTAKAVFFKEEVSIWWGQKRKENKYPNCYTYVSYKAIKDANGEEVEGTLTLPKDTRIIVHPHWIEIEDEDNTIIPISNVSSVMLNDDGKEYLDSLKLIAE